MSIRGLRVHIAGSASARTDRELLQVAHAFVQRLTGQLINIGAGVVVSASGDPVSDAGVPLIFDWTVLDVLANSPDPAPEWPGDGAGRFRVVASQRGLQRIIETRQGTWRSCTARSDFEVDTIPPGWRMGGSIRTRQVQLGDVLVVLGGGAGVEHLAELYIEEGKSVIPIRCDLGSITDDGNGGGSYLHGRALNETSTFFELAEDAGGPTARLSGITLLPGDNAEQVADAVVGLLQDLRPLRAFYVRLLDPKHEAFPSVEGFFRDVVDDVVTAKGFTPHEVGRSDPLSAFINVEIFEGIHRAGLIIADLSGVRPNCTMELGYALARPRRTVISAMEGTRLPFDSDKLPTHFWNPGGPNQLRIDKYKAWIERYIDMPPVVQ